MWTRRIVSCKNLVKLKSILRINNGGGRSRTLSISPVLTSFHPKLYIIENNYIPTARQKSHMDNMVHVPVVLPLDNERLIIEGAKTLILQARPDWNCYAESLNFQFFTEGITNKILSCWCDHSGKEDRVLVRIFGEGTEMVVDRKLELANMSILYENNCGPPVYMTFTNGIVYGFVPGQVLDTVTVREEKIARQICKSIAEMHMINPPSGSVIKKHPFLIDKMNFFHSNMPDGFTDPTTQHRYETQFPSKEELQKEINLVKDLMGYIKSPVVYCHNDLLLKNIVYNPKIDTIRFIDYEYAAFNYQCFDIGDHFTEYAGVDEVDFSLYPEEEYQRWWLGVYLENWHRLNSLPPPTPTDVQRLYVQVNIGATISHIFWSLWAVIQAKHSTIDFDYLQYGIDRYAEYKKMKEKYFKLKLP